MNKEQRRNNLLPNGIPRWIRCYDYENDKFMDRYTVVFSHAQSFYTKGWIPVLCMSENPYHPQGIGLHEEYPICGNNALLEGKRTGHWPPAIGRKGNLGKRIEFKDLPEQCQKLVMDDYTDYWNLKTKVTGKIYKVEKDWYEYILKNDDGRIWDSKIETYNGVQQLTKLQAGIALAEAIIECNVNGNKSDYGF